MALYSECVKAESLPLAPLDDNIVSPQPLCWLALSNTDLHTRVRQCWAHEPATEQLNVSLYLPVDPIMVDGATVMASDLLTIDAWEQDPDSTTSAASGVEAWEWELHPDGSDNVVLAQVDICASLTDEERGRAHLTDLPRCGTEFREHDTRCTAIVPDPDWCNPVGIRLPSIFLAPGTG